MFGEGDKADQAFTVVANEFQEIADIKKKHPGAAGLPPDDAYIIDFCPPFFKMPQASVLFEELKTGKKSKREMCNLDNQDTTARVMLHEMTHLPWTLDTNKDGDIKDIVGLPGMCAKATLTFSKTPESVQPPAFNSFTSKTADTYAWFGVYEFLNKASECQGIQWTDDSLFTAQCTDVWAPGKEKWTKNTWPRFSKGSQ